MGMKKGPRNFLLGSMLVSFVGGVYIWTTTRVKQLDIFAPVANELDEIREMKKESKESGQAKSKGLK